MQTGIHIGAKIDKHSLEPLTDAVVRIMEVKADQETIRAALGVLGSQLQTNNNVFSNVMVDGDRTHHHHYYGEKEDAKAEETDDVSEPASTNIDEEDD